MNRLFLFIMSLLCTVFSSPSFIDSLQSFVFWTLSLNTQNANMDFASMLKTCNILNACMNLIPPFMRIHTSPLYQALSCASRRPATALF